MSEVAAETPKKKGRPKGSGKKRHDPDDAPVNGDYQMDVVFNKEEGKRYAWLKESNDHDDDSAKFKHRGYTRTERREGGPKPAWDVGSTQESCYRVGGLTLYECPEELAAKHDRVALRRQEQRVGAIRATAEANGGNLTVTPGLTG